MSRRTRRARRRIRRGYAHREPLLLVTDDYYPGEALEALARGIYRYRSELAPFATSGGLAGAGAILHAQHPGWALGVAVLAASVSAGLAWPRITPTLRRIERVYAVAVTATAGAWLALAVTFGPGAGPLRGVLVALTAAAGVPWWAHRRRRAKVRVERTLDAWPDIAEAIGLPGSRVMSAVVDLWGWRARIGLRRGQTVTDLISRVPALESGLGTRPGAVRVEPDPARADHAVIRVLDSDPHAHAIPWPGSNWPGDDDQPPSVMRPIRLGLFEDARPVTVTIAHRHALLGGVAGAGKSGVLNVILASLAACPDVVLWGIDLKGGMEFGPWAACLNRLATTLEDASGLLAEGVAILEARAELLAAEGARLWKPTATAPALVIVIDEYAELSEQAAEALAYADSIARRGRAVAVTLLVATQRPTQKAMGAGAVRSQMDVRICLRVRERRDVDLVLGQGMLAAGWTAHTLEAPGKFLISTPEHQYPRRARAYLLTDADVHQIASRQGRYRPLLDETSQVAANDAARTLEEEPGKHTAPGMPQQRTTPDIDGAADPDPDGSDTEPSDTLWDALLRAPAEGASVPRLMTATGMSRSWIYRRLQEYADAGRAEQVSRGRWRPTPNGETDSSTVTQR